MSEDRPGPTGERLAFVDALRGYALMGLFLVHMSEEYELYWADPQPSTIHDAVFALFAGKAFALLALCFGFSFHVIMARAAARGIGGTARFAWRMLLLALIGWLHGLVYRGDILVVLAPVGLLLLPLHRVRSQRSLGAVVALLLAQPLLIALILAGFAGSGWALRRPGFFDDPAMSVYLNGSFVQTVAANLWAGEAEKWRFVFGTGRFFQIAGLFVVGLMLGRAGVFARPATFARALWRWLGAAVVVLLLLSLARPVAAEVAPGLRVAAVRTRIDLLLAGWIDLAATAVTLIALTLLWQGPARGLLALLAPAGRLTLTFYIAQSLVFVPLFYGFGSGWYATATQAQATGLGLAAFAVQLALAHWYVRRFRHGPLEWLWRAGTELRLDLPFRHPRRRHGADGEEPPPAAPSSAAPTFAALAEAANSAAR